ncbi:hypothetical protein KA012_00210 [Candidatus Woesebacteria bacterium]|nr:hypothetical protein [Candidatus Woesebacteria bacterium]
MHLSVIPTNLRSVLKKVPRIDVVILTTLVVCVIAIFHPLLQNKLLVSDDYEHHAARLANYFLALKQGQILPRWAPNLNDGFGYPVFNYTYHTPYVVGSTFHALGFPIEQSVNLTVLASLVSASLGIYLTGRMAKMKSWDSLILSLFYVVNPYILLTVFWRGAVGELYAYACIPFVLATTMTGNTRSSETSQRLLLFSQVILLSILILSHIPFAAFAILSIIGWLFLQSNSRKKLMQFLISLLLSILLTGWYWIPAQFEQSFTTYSAGTSLSQYATQFTIALDLLKVWRTSLSSEYFLQTLQLGFVPIIAISAAVIILFVKRNSGKHVATWYWIAVILGSIMIMDPISKPIWDILYPLQILQYPWRLLAIVNIASILIIISIYKEISAKARFFIISLVFLSVCLAIFGYARIKGVANHSDNYWYQSAETGTSFDENRPLWFITPMVEIPPIIFLEDPSIPEQTFLPPENLTIDTFDGSNITYSVNATASGYLIHHRAYFPGWEVVVDGEFVPIQYQLNLFRGLIAFPVSAGEHEVAIRFSSTTPARQIGVGLSVVGVLLLLWIIAMKKPTK